MRLRSAARAAALRHEQIHVERNEYTQHSAHEAARNETMVNDISDCPGGDEDIGESAANVRDHHASSDIVVETAGDVCNIHALDEAVTELVADARNENGGISSSNHLDISHESNCHYPEVQHGSITHEEHSEGIHETTGVRSMDDTDVRSGQVNANHYGFYSGLMQLNALSSLEDFCFDGDCNGDASSASQALLSSDEPPIKAKQRGPNRKFMKIGAFETFEAAEVCRDNFNDFYYTRKGCSKSTNTYSRIYRCRSHVKCEHVIQVKHVLFPSVFFEVDEHGTHCKLVEKKVPIGIHKSLKTEVDSLLEMGNGARSMFLVKYKSDEIKTRQIPSIRQIENRKSALKDRRNGKWQFITFGEIHQWSSSRLCHAQAQFLDENLDDFIVLDSFQPRMLAVIVKNPSGLS